MEWSVSTGPTRRVAYQPVLVEEYRPSRPMTKDEKRQGGVVMMIVGLALGGFGYWMWNANR